MGNWRTVQIIGTCDKADLDALKGAVTVGDDYEGFHCLCYCGPSICGLGNWPAETINAIGNLAERDYSVDSVADALRDLVTAAPSLNVKIHCGGDWEDRTCIATLIAGGGSVTVAEPEIAELPEISQAQMADNFFACLRR